MWLPVLPHPHQLSDSHGNQGDQGGIEPTTLLFGDILYMSSAVNNVLFFIQERTNAGY